MLDMSERDQIIDRVIREMTPDRLRDLVAFALDTSGALINVGCSDNVSIPTFIREEIAADDVVVDRITATVAEAIRRGAATEDDLREAVEMALNARAQEPV